VTTDLRPHELRELLEREVRAAFEQQLAAGEALDAALLAGTVLNRYQGLPEVQQRLAFLWVHLEAYASMLIVERG
jgi:hypothetical protein